MHAVETILTVTVCHRGIVLKKPTKCEMAYTCALSRERNRRDIFSLHQNLIIDEISIGRSVCSCYSGACEVKIILANRKLLLTHLRKKTAVNFSRSLLLEKNEHSWIYSSKQIHIHFTEGPSSAKTQHGRYHSFIFFVGHIIYTFVRNKVLYESTKVLSYFRKYESTFVPSKDYLAWYKVLSYLRRYFRTFVLSYILRARVQLYTTTRACTVGILYSTSFENESNRSTISYCTVCTRTLKHIKQILPSGISNMKVSCLSTFVSSKIKLLRKYENRILSYHTSISFIDLYLVRRYIVYKVLIT